MRRVPPTLASSSVLSASPGPRDALTAAGAPRGGDPRADIWAVGATAEANCCRRFLIPLDSEPRWIFFLRVDGLKGPCFSGGEGVGGVRRRLVMLRVMQREVNLGKDTEQQPVNNVHFIIDLMELLWTGKKKEFCEENESCQNAGKAMSSSMCIQCF